MSRHVRPYSGPRRKCPYGPEPAAWDVAGFLSCGDIGHLERACAAWGDAGRRRRLADAQLRPDALRDAARALLARYRGLERQFTGLLGRELWAADVAELLERIAGES